MMMFQGLSTGAKTPEDVLGNYIFQSESISALIWSVKNVDAAQICASLVNKE